jgi:hypothetical protein
MTGAALKYLPIPASPRPTQSRPRTRHARYDPFSRQPRLHPKPRQGVKNRTARYAPGLTLKTHANAPGITPVATEAAVGCSVAAKSIPLNTKVALQGVTNRAVADLAANRGLARDLMSPGSYRHLVEGTNLAPASYGKAVERLTARYVQADSELSQILSYQSRPFKSTPDFFGYEGYNLRTLASPPRLG